MDVDGAVHEDLQIPAQQFELALVSLVQRAQGEHGVKHSDFKRYR